jgi:hypothetical protein
MERPNETMRCGLLQNQDRSRVVDRRSGIAAANQLLFAELPQWACQSMFAA